MCIIWIDIYIHTFVPLLCIGSSRLWTRHLQRAQELLHWQAMCSFSRGKRNLAHWIHPLWKQSFLLCIRHVATRSEGLHQSRLLCTFGEPRRKLSMKLLYPNYFNNNYCYSIRQTNIQKPDPYGYPYKYRLPSLGRPAARSSKRQTLRGSSSLNQTRRWVGGDLGTVWKFDRFSKHCPKPHWKGREGHPVLLHRIPIG